MNAVLIYMAIVAVLAVCSLKWPAVVVATVLCMYGLKQWGMATSQFFIAYDTLINFVTAGLVALGLGVLFVKNRLYLGMYPRVGGLTLLLFLLAAVSFLWAFDTDEYIARWIATVPYIILMVVMVPFLFNDSDDLRKGLLATLLVGSLTLILLAFSVQWAGRHVMIGYGEQLGSPLAVATLAGYVIIIGTLMNFHGVGRIWQILRWVLVMLGIYVIILSGTRGQFIAALICILLFLPLSRRLGNWRGIVSTVFGLIVLGIIMGWAYTLIEGEARWDFREMYEVYFDTRIYPTLFLLQNWLEQGPLSWIIGLGSAASESPEINDIYPHFVPGEVLGELGLVGFTLYAAILILTVLTIRRGFMLVRDDPKLRGDFIALSALVTYQFILSLKQGSLNGHTWFFGFVIMLGRIELSYQYQYLQATLQDTAEEWGLWPEEQSPGIDGYAYPAER